MLISQELMRLNWRHTDTQKTVHACTELKQTDLQTPIRTHTCPAGQATSVAHAALRL